MKQNYHLRVFSQDIKVCKGTSFPKPESWVPAVRQPVFEFSKPSRDRLMSYCRNSGYKIASQFCLTYQDTWPLDGKEAKRQLNHFLVALKRFSPCPLDYLWVLEFQERRAPHFHFFSSLETAGQDWQGLPFSLPVTAHDLALIWVQQVQRQHAPGSIQSLDFHSHENNFFAWDMQTGGYLAKNYIGKSSQKDVPEEFKNVGRFWGCSRSFIPASYVVDPYEVEDVNLVGAIDKFVRTVGKKYENERASYCRYVKSLLQAGVRRAVQEKGVDSEEARRKQNGLSAFRKKAPLISALRAKTTGYVMIGATSLFFQFMDGYHRMGAFAQLNWTPF